MLQMCSNQLVIWFLFSHQALAVTLLRAKVLG